MIPFPQSHKVAFTQRDGRDVIKSVFEDIRLLLSGNLAGLAGEAQVGTGRLDAEIKGVLRDLGRGEGVEEVRVGFGCVVECSSSVDAPVFVKS